MMNTFYVYVGDSTGYLFLQLQDNGDYTRWDVDYAADVLLDLHQNRVSEISYSDLPIELRQLEEFQSVSDRIRAIYKIND